MHPDCRFRERHAYWYAHPALDCKTEAVITERNDDAVTVVSKLGSGTSDEGVEYTLTYRIFSTGRVQVTVDFVPHGSLPDLMRIGMKTSLPAEYGAVRWLGRGPQETYADRKTGAKIGRFRSTVRELVHGYIRPQQNGNRTDVRWVEFTDAGSSGIGFSADSVMEFTARPYTMDDLEHAKHDMDLPVRDHVEVLIDHRQMGVGGDNSWGADVHPEYCIPCKPYSYAFDIYPVFPNIGKTGTPQKN
jgi:beta-galactosidase